MPLGIGWYHDDGVYVATANAIAEGRGPRLDYLPGTPFATRYPLLWPSLLALCLRLAQASRADLTGPLVLLPIAIAFPLAVLAWGRFLRRSWGLGRAPAAFLLAALALNPVCLEFCRFPMSEIPFLALSLWAVALADDPAPPTRAREAAAACLAVAALHTRLAGAALLAALICAFAVRRRAFALVFTLVLAGASLGGWALFLRTAHASNAAFANSPLLAYDLGYGGYAAGGAGRVAQALIESPRLAFFAAHIALGATLPMRWLARAQAGGSAWPLVAAVVGLAVLVAIGALERLRSPRAPRPLARVETWYVPLTLGVVMAWPAGSWRLLLPLAPWLLALPVLGIARLAGNLRGAPELASAAVALLAMGGMSWNVPPAPGFFLAGGLAVDATALEGAMGAVRRLPRDAIVASPMAPLVWLRTGRPGVGAWVERGVKGTSIEGRSLRTFFIGGGDSAVDPRPVREAIAEYPRWRAGYALSRKFPPPDLFGAAVADVPGTRLLFTSRDYDLYALARPDSAAPGGTR